jgi:hypothetical protein
MEMVRELATHQANGANKALCYSTYMLNLIQERVCPLDRENLRRNYLWHPLPMTLI